MRVSIWMIALLVVLSTGAHACAKLRPIFPDMLTTSETLILGRVAAVDTTQAAVPWDPDAKINKRKDDKPASIIAVSVLETIYGEHQDFRRVLMRGIEKVRSAELMGKVVLVGLNPPGKIDSAGLGFEPFVASDGAAIDEAYYKPCGLTLGVVDIRLIQMMIAQEDRKRFAPNVEAILDEASAAAQ